MGLTNEHVGPKYKQKSRAMSSPEPNYFSIFAMRYPVKGVLKVFESCSQLPEVFNSVGAAHKFEDLLLQFCKNCEKRNYGRKLYFVITIVVRKIVVIDREKLLNVFQREFSDMILRLDFHFYSCPSGQFTRYFM